MPLTIISTIVSHKWIITNHYQPTQSSPLTTGAPAWDEQVQPAAAPNTLGSAELVNEDYCWLTRVHGWFGIVPDGGYSVIT